MIRLALLLALAPAAALAADLPAGFTPGPRVPGFGPVAEVETAAAIPADASFRIAFDVAERAKPATLNRGIESAARTLNMHARAGVPAERSRVAVVVHGPAAHDLLNAAAYGRRNDGAANASAPLIAALLGAGGEVRLCGQTSAALGIAPGELLPGVKLELSAITAHALLQSQGFTLNPF